MMSDTDRDLQNRLRLDYGTRARVKVEGIDKKTTALKIQGIKDPITFETKDGRDPIIVVVDGSVIYSRGGRVVSAEPERAGDSLDRLLKDPDAYFKAAKKQAVEDLKREAEGRRTTSSVSEVYVLRPAEPIERTGASSKQGWGTSRSSFTGAFGYKGKRAGVKRTSRSLLKRQKG
jgi:hypothetical protein